MKSKSVRSQVLDGQKSDYKLFFELDNLFWKSIIFIGKSSIHQPDCAVVSLASFLVVHYISKFHLHSSELSSSCSSAENISFQLVVFDNSMYIEKRVLEKVIFFQTEFFSRKKPKIFFMKCWKILLFVELTCFIYNKINIITTLIQ